MTVINLPPENDYTPAVPDRWPMMSHPGYFYINDRQYYLYASKKCITLRDATHLRYQLPFLPIPGTVSVTVGGQAWSNFDVEGDVVWVKLDNLEQYSYGQPDLDLEWWEEAGFMYGPECLVSISFQYNAWLPADVTPEPTGNMFVTYTGMQTYYVQDATVVYKLTTQHSSGSGLIPELPPPGTPIVITDDTILYTDDRSHQMEFHVDPETGVITFNTNENCLLNPSFEADNGTGVLPQLWFWDAPYSNVTVLGHGGLHGENYVRFADNGRLEQTFVANRRNPYVLSAYFRGSGTGHIQVAFYDPSGYLLGSTVTADVTGSSDTWTRGYLYLGEPDWESDETFTPIPTGTESIKVSVYGAGMECDGVKAEADWSATDFNPLSPTITIEYETDGGNPFKPVEDFQDRWDPWPTGVSLMENAIADANSINSRECLNYYIGEEVSATGDMFLGCGGWASGIDPALTGFITTDYAGTYIKVGRRHVPYAKVSGFNKYRRRATFHRPNPPRYYDISRFGDPDWAPRPKTIEVSSLPDMFLDTDNEVALSVVSATGYERPLEFFVYDQRGLPAFHHQVEFTTISGVITTSTWTDESGGARCIYDPPDGRTGHIDDIYASIDTPDGTITDHIRVYGYNDPELDYNYYFNPSIVAYTSFFGDYPSLEVDLFAYYKFEDNLATTVVLDDTNSFHGTLVGGKNTEDVHTSGRVYHGFDLDGTNDYVDLSGLEANQGDVFDINRPFTFAGWVKWTSNPAVSTSNIAGSETVTLGGHGWRAYVAGGVGPSTGKIYFFLIDNNAGTWWSDYSTTALTSGNWGFVVVSYDGSGVHTGMHVYVNAVEENNYSTSGNVGNFSQPSPELYIGNLMDGVLDECGLWGRTLNQNEITWLYNGGSGRTRQ